jgi:large subunit ribosomal protein L18e
MKQTGPTKKSTRVLVRLLEKAAVERKQAIWKTVAEILEKPARQRVSVNLSKLERLAKKFKGKTFLVPGKILASGILNEKISVAALGYSGNARKKIIAMHGKAVSIAELLQAKEKPGSIMIVK